jgi:hypothetical protein
LLIEAFREREKSEVAQFASRRVGRRSVEDCVAELLGCRLEQERLWYYVVCGPATMSNQKVAKKELVSALSNKETVGTIAKRGVGGK